MRPAIISLDNLFLTMLGFYYDRLLFIYTIANVGLSMINTYGKWDGKPVKLKACNSVTFFESYSFYSSLTKTLFTPFSSFQNK